MRSEDFWLLARLERGSMAAAPCDRAKTQPKAKKTAAHRANHVAMEFFKML